MVKKQSDMNKNIPEGIWILSVALFAGALLSVLLALWMFSAADQLISPSSTASLALVQAGVNVTSITFVNMGLLFIIVALVSYFIGRGLLKLQNRARIALVLVVMFTLALSIYSFIISRQIYVNIFTLVVNVVVLWYLFQKKTIKVFK